MNETDLANNLSDNDDFLDKRRFLFLTADALKSNIRKYKRLGLISKDEANRALQIISQISDCENRVKKYEDVDRHKINM